MTRENIISFFFAALLLFILYSTLLILSPFIHPIFWAATIAFGFYPFFERILSVCKNRRDIAAFLATLVIFLVFVPLIVLILTNLLREVLSAYVWVLNWVKVGGVEKLVEQIKSHPWVQRVESSELFQIEFIRENLKSVFVGFAEIIGRVSFKQALFATKSFFAAIINFFLMTFLVFFFFKDGDKIYRFIYRITPLKEHIKKIIFSQISDTFSAVFRGQIVTAVAQAGIAGAIYWALGLPLPLFFAGVTFLAALVPVFGAAMVWVPFVVYLAIIGQHRSAIILLCLGVFVISLVDNVLKPILIGEKTKLPYILLFLGILGGLQVYGISGIFLAPAVLSLFFILIKIYQEEIFSEKN